MSIRTLKMLAAKQSAVKLWIPANEVSGDSVFDIVNGLGYADSATVERTVANAPTIVTAANGTITGLDSVTIPKFGALVASWQVAVSYALQVFALASTTTGKGILLTPSTCSLRDADSVAVNLASAQTPAPGTDFTAAIAWDTSTAYMYAGSGAPLSLVDTDVLPASVISMLDSGAAFTTTSQINSVASPFYGAMLLGWDSGLPGDLTDGLSWLANAWINGDKRPYPGWND